MNTSPDSFIQRHPTEPDHKLTDSTASTVGQNARGRIRGGCASKMKGRVVKARCNGSTIDPPSWVWPGVFRPTHSTAGCRSLSDTGTDAFVPPAHHDTLRGVEEAGWLSRDVGS